MIKKIHNLIVGSIIIFFSSFSLADDHTQNYFVETIPMSLIGESNLEDLLNTGKPFRNGMENGDDDEVEIEREGERESRERKRLRERERERENVEMSAG